MLDIPSDALQDVSGDPFAIQSDLSHWMCQTCGVLLPNVHEAFQHLLADTPEDASSPAVWQLRQSWVLGHARFVPTGMFAYISDALDGGTTIREVKPEFRSEIGDYLAEKFRYHASRQLLAHQ